MDFDAISDKMSGEALDFVIAEKDRERKKALAQSAGVVVVKKGSKVALDALRRYTPAKLGKLRGKSREFVFVETSWDEVSGASSKSSTLQKLASEFQHLARKERATEITRSELEKKDKTPSRAKR
jgi:hypothetical protein